MLWVDGSDPAWLEEKSRYSPVNKDYGSSDNRYRDWDNLQYWFRGVEKFAPWVNNIYFITWGHLPAWLNRDHPKLKIVRHSDYIPAEYLPTFNSNPIELNLHRIPELSEQFVLFNDDVFLTGEVKPEDFFMNGQPRDEMVFNPILPKGELYGISFTNLSNLNVLNEHFNKSQVVRKYPWKIFNLKYGTGVFRSLLLLPWNCFLGFVNPHCAASHLKSTFAELWEVCGDKLDQTSRNRFRKQNDLNHWLMRYWNLCRGNFVPRSRKFWKYFNLTDNNAEICAYIRKQKAKMICVNDMIPDIDLDKAKREINGSLEAILPEKSSFEL